MDKPTENKDRPPLKNNFQLRWATGADACIHSGGEWQLHFKHGAPREFANQHLLRSEWVSYREDPTDEIYYVFLKGGHRSIVLENLIKAGIPKDDIEIAE